MRKLSRVQQRIAAEDDADTREFHLDLDLQEKGILRVKVNVRDSGLSLHGLINDHIKKVAERALATMHQQV